MVVLMYDIENPKHPSASVHSYLSRKYEDFVLTDERRAALNTLLHNLTTTITNAFPEARIATYGSFGAGVAVSRSDLDVSVSLPIPKERELPTVRQLVRILSKAGYKNPHFANVKNMWCVFGRDSELHVKFDITLNQPNGSTVTSIVRSAATNEVTARHLIVLVKEFAKCQGINNASKGTLSSIAYCFLCIYFLIKCKILPPVPSGNEIHDLSSENIANLLEEFQTLTLNFEATPDPLLSDLLYSFFRFYTQDFDFKVHAISLSHAGLVNKADLGWPHTDVEGNVILENQVVILNPYGSENMSRSVSKDGMQIIEDAFKAACKILLDGRAKALFHIPPKPKQ
ncbi:hypothetical protein POM88_037305 [Heracleum sosnowskyi]|uniref:Uncharacterized protein n=1 Tax=Heracleum sosnowskyi TaxID=360622 RepID=A0AAD8HQU9_9APIA|nr:hypothetical protein POM88_037305 [Heracleum sosnowskyi]